MDERNNTTATRHTVDASGERLGRVASRVAHLLMGKEKTTVTRNQVSGSPVLVKNINEMDIDQKKRDAKKYVRYSGYPGGKKEEAMEHLIERKGVAEVLRRAVYGMLPANKLRAERMKLLTIE
jgi:large subunit ribosomal protein L13